MHDGLTESTLRQWMQRLAPSLMVLARGICRDHHRAEEIVQEAFVRLWRQPPDAGEIAYPSWLRRVVTNLSINALKRTRRPGALPEYSTDPVLTSGDRPEARSETDEQLSQLEAALGRLDAPKRVILLLRAQDGMSYEAIAEHLDVPIGTVMSRLNRARSALMDELQRAETPQSEAFDIRRYRKA